MEEYILTTAQKPSSRRSTTQKSKRSKTSSKSCRVTLPSSPTSSNMIETAFLLLFQELHGLEGVFRLSKLTKDSMIGTLESCPCYSCNLLRSRMDLISKKVVATLSSGSASPGISKSPSN